MNWLLLVLHAASVLMIILILVSMLICNTKYNLLFIKYILNPNLCWGVYCCGYRLVVIHLNFWFAVYCILDWVLYMCGSLKKEFLFSNSIPPMSPLTACQITCRPQKTCMGHAIGSCLIKAKSTLQLLTNWSTTCCICCLPFRLSWQSMLLIWIFPIKYLYRAIEQDSLLLQGFSKNNQEIMQQAANSCFFWVKVSLFVELNVLWD